MFVCLPLLAWWRQLCDPSVLHYDDVITGTIASQITSLTSVYSTVYSGAEQSKHQSSTSLAFVWGIHRGPVNSPHKRPVTRKMFPFDDVIMIEVTVKDMWRITHYDDFKWPLWRLKLPVNRDFVKRFVQNDNKKHQRSAILSLVRGIHRWPGDSFHKGTVTWKMFNLFAS